MCREFVGYGSEGEYQLKEGLYRTVLQASLAGVSLRTKNVCDGGIKSLKGRDEAENRRS